MARTYANIDAGIWLDPEFCGLSAGAQRTYFMLITQTNIAACGSLALTLRRWSKTCAEKELEVWLAELSDARFVLIDEDTEELLVRTFVKWDGGHRHPTRVKAVIATARAIASPELRETAAVELGKLGVSIASTVPPDTHPTPTPDPPQSYRDVVKERNQESIPETTLREREPAPPLQDVEPPLGCSKHPNGTDTKCGPCGTARLRHQRWEKREARRAAELKADAARRQSEAVIEELRQAKAEASPRPREVSA